MDRLNLVEKLRTKTGITYEDAKMVLEINNWDILDAILDLERQGKIKGPSVSTMKKKIHNLTLKKLKKIVIINLIVPLREFLRLYVSL